VSGQRASEGLHSWVNPGLHWMAVGFTWVACSTIPEFSNVCAAAPAFGCRASGLVLADLSVTKEKKFTAIAVTAHQWVPLLEVPGGHSLAGLGWGLSLGKSLLWRACLGGLLQPCCCNLQAVIDCPVLLASPCHLPAWSACLQRRP
jgi:hypothetical protein